MDYRLTSSADFPELRAPRYFLDLDSPPKSDWTRSTLSQPYHYASHYSDTILGFSHFPDLQTAATRPMTDTSGSSNNEPYPYAYHYVDDILSFVEFSDGSFQVPVAYHFDITNIRLYFVELENGSVVSVTKAGPGSCVTSGDDYLVADSYRLAYEWNGGEVATVLQYEVSNNAETEKKNIEPESTGKGDKKEVEASEEPSSSGSAIFCMDRLREELSCAICLEICFEPTTTPCGHSFCNECLRSAADICGNRCPKCRKFISKKRSGAVNTVLWNTIQLLFPKEVEGRNAAGDLTGRETHHRNPVIFASDSGPVRFASDSSPVIFASDSGPVRFASDSGISRSTTDSVQAFHTPDSRSQSPQRRNSHHMTGQSVRTYGMSRRGGEVSSRTRREFHYPPITPDSRSQSPPRRNSHYMTGQSVRTYGMSSRGGNSSSRARREFHYPPIHDDDEDEDEDAALALRLQREEYMETYGIGAF